LSSKFSLLIISTPANDCAEQKSQKPLLQQIQVFELFFTPTHQP